MTFGPNHGAIMHTKLVKGECCDAEKQVLIRNQNRTWVLMQDEVSVVHAGVSFVPLLSGQCASAKCLLIDDLIGIDHMCSAAVAAVTY